MKIVTHKGQSHRDEFMACCLMLYYYADLSIERRDCTPADLEDPGILVIDQGGEFEVARGNLDHHQLPRDAAPTCSITKVMEAMCPNSIPLAREVWLWLEFSEWLDSKGPGDTAAHYGMTQDALMATVSPIETTVLRWFQSHEVVSVRSPLHHLMCQIGAEKMEYLDKVQRRLTRLADEASSNLYGNVLALDNTNIDRDDEPTLGVELFIRRNFSNAGPDVIVAQDDRGEGYSLYRRNDSPRVDFSRLEGHEDVTFAHKSGFIAKTTCDASWRELVKLAIVPAVKPEPSVDEVCFGATPAAV
jgi:hypothetical protein